MAKRPYAIIDVDLTFVDSVCGPHGWLQWLNAKTGQSITPEDAKWNYNLGKIFSEHWPKHCTEGPMDWWRYPGIYDQMTPLYGAVETLEMIHDMGYDIIFVSHCKGSHMKSKFTFLKAHVGHIMKGFVATKEKFLINSGTGRDFVIDDRNDYLNQFDDDTTFKVKFSTKWTQYTELTSQIPEVSSWPELIKTQGKSLAAYAKND
jgi:hypothetical protein